MTEEWPRDGLTGAGAAFLAADAATAGTAVTLSAFECGGLRMNVRVGENMNDHQWAASEQRCHQGPIMNLPTPGAVGGSTPAGYVTDFTVLEPSGLTISSVTTFDPSILIDVVTVEERIEPPLEDDFSAVVLMMNWYYD